MSSEPSNNLKNMYTEASLGLGRRLSAATVLFHSAISDKLGLNVTDLKCWDQLALSGPTTAGRLAEITGLTTGAITGVIDRLEEAGFVRRERDTHDRRVVTIYPLMEREKDVGQFYAPLAQAMQDLMIHYKPEEARLFMELLERSINILQEETLRLRGASS